MTKSVIEQKNEIIQAIVSSPILLKNSNGNMYLIIEVNSNFNNYLLKSLKDTPTPYVIAKNFDFESSTWKIGIYYQNLVDAVKYWNEIK